MAAPKKDPATTPKKSRPAKTTEGRENQLISLAVDLVEKRIRNGTATSQETTHYLKLGSTRERLEQERLSNENRLTQAKIDAIASQTRQEEMYTKALEAMRAYAGHSDPEEYSDSDYDDDY